MHACLLEFHHSALFSFIVDCDQSDSSKNLSMVCIDPPPTFNLTTLSSRLGGLKYDNWPKVKEL